MKDIRSTGIWMALAGVILGMNMATASASDNATVAATTNTPAPFTNPVAPSGADPWVIRHGDAYYFCQSRRGAIWVNETRRLQDLGVDHWKQVWKPEPGKPWSRELWAPELHFIRGKWWIYVAADDGNNNNHRMYVLEGSSSNPQEPFTFKGKIAAPTDRWAIDGTVIQMPGDKLYFVWSGWEGTNNVAQHLYIAPMSDPGTISGERVRISTPELDWELHGTPLINEGPEALWNGDKLFLIYSASGSWGDDYCLGQLAWTGGDPMSPGSWVKKRTPVFSKTPNVFGPGHGSFVLSRDGRENWLVYHSARSSGAGWNRRVNLQRFTWNADGSPEFGVPIAAGIPMTEPSGDSAP
jgi:GH43 family beta-xylosidase